MKYFLFWLLVIATVVGFCMIAYFLIKKLFK